MLPSSLHYAVLSDILEMLLTVLLAHIFRLWLTLKKTTDENLNSKSTTFPNLARWIRHMESFPEKEIESWI